MLWIFNAFFNFSTIFNYHHLRHLWILFVVSSVHVCRPLCAFSLLQMQLYKLYAFWCSILSYNYPELIIKFIVPLKRPNEIGNVRTDGILNCIWNFNRYMKFISMYVFKAFTNFHVKYFAFNFQIPTEICRERVERGNDFFDRKV